MSFISIFDVMGPNMIGPSSSHTAGAVRIGKISRLLLGAKPRFFSPENDQWSTKRSKLYSLWLFCKDF